MEGWITDGVGVLVIVAEGDRQGRKDRASGESNLQM